MTDARRSMVGSAVLLAWVSSGELGHKRQARTHLGISFLLNKVLERLLLSPRVTAYGVRIAIHQKSDEKIGFLTKRLSTRFGNTAALPVVSTSTR